MAGMHVVDVLSTYTDTSTCNYLYIQGIQYKDEETNLYHKNVPKE